MTKRTTIELEDYYERILDALIEKGIYKNKIEAIRASIRAHGENCGVPI